MLQVDPKTTIPTRSVLITVVISALLGLISVGSPVAFNNVVSLTINSLYASYFMACFLLLWRRIQGTILDSATALASGEAPRANIPGSAGRLLWGPWRIREPWGTVINGLACAYLVIVFIFTFFPPATPVTPTTMNYSVLVMGFVTLVSAIYFLVWGHRTYKGPIVDVEHFGT